MDLQTFQENWGVICRKFPLVCAIDLTQSTLQEIKESIKFYSIHFDHIFVLTKNTSQEDLKDFCLSERIINLTCFCSKNVKGESLEDKIKILTKNQMILVTINSAIHNSDVRWKIYEKVKEMKSPLTNIIRLDSEFKYCDEDKTSFVVKLRLS